MPVVWSVLMQETLETHPRSLEVNTINLGLCGSRNSPLSIDSVVNIHEPYMLQSVRSSQDGGIFVLYTSSSWKGVNYRKAVGNPWPAFFSLCPSCVSCSHSVLSLLPLILAFYLTVSFCLGSFPFFPSPSILHFYTSRLPPPLSFHHSQQIFKCFSFISRSHFLSPPSISFFYTHLLFLSLISIFSALPGYPFPFPTFLSFVKFSFLLSLSHNYIVFLLYISRSSFEFFIIFPFVRFRLPLQHLPQQQVLSSEAVLEGSEAEREFINRPQLTQPPTRELELRSLSSKATKICLGETKQRCVEWF